MKIGWCEAGNVLARGFVFYSREPQAMGRIALVAFSVLVAVTTTLGFARTRNDAPLLAALRADPELARCACIVGAGWLDLSYPRVRVDARRWKALRGATVRRRFGARALNVAEATYLAEFASEDQYAQLTIVDVRDRVLFTYEP